MSDTEEPQPPFTRRHKQLLRRESSFRKLESVPARVDDWFHTDAAVHGAWEAFVAANRGKSPLFSRDVNDATTMLEADHVSRQVHEAFCELFEAQLAAFLGAQKVSMDEFQEAFRLSRDEESRDGTCFYRWPDVVEFEVFLTLMRGGPAALLKRIDDLTDHARQEHRKKVALFPLILQLQPASFAALDEAIQAALTASNVSLNLTKVQLKELARWKVKLVGKKLNADGVFADPPPDEQEWARYLAFLTSHMDAASFDRFVATTTKPVDAASSGAPNTDRQLVLKCFGALDAHHRGWLELSWLASIVAKADVANERALKRSIARWNHVIRQQSLDMKATGTTDQADESALPGRLSMLQVLEFLEELLLPKDGADRSTLYHARLQKLAEVARDRS
jgi:hypothetical protein